MSLASANAWENIVPQLPRREADVLRVLRIAAEAPGFAGSHRRGPCGMTNRQIASSLGLDRDSVSPRTSRLWQKGLVVEAGISGSETLYEAAFEPNFIKAPGKRKPKAYHDGVKDALEILNCHLGEKRDPDSAAALDRAHKRIMELLK